MACTCPGEGPLRCMDCPGCGCAAHWRPAATADDILAEFGWDEVVAAVLRKESDQRA